MKTIIVDDDAIARDIFQFYASTMNEIEVERLFDNPEAAIEYARHNPVELAILDIQMPVMNGIELGYRLRSCNPKLMLIYATAAEKYVFEALKLRVAAYLLKPLDREEFTYAVQSAKLLSKGYRKPVYARTFGYFDLFVDGKPLMFKSAKAKELLALLIDRCGGTITTDQIIAVLWENRPNDDATQNLCSKIVKTLQRELNEYGIGDVLIQRRGVRSINLDKIDCDLYEFLEGGSDAVNRFMGDYMLEYSWAEERMNALWSYVNRKK